MDRRDFIKATLSAGAAAVVCSSALTCSVGCRSGAEKNGKLTSRSKNLTKDYDLIVVGGGMAGVAAAVAASRNGTRTLLIESSSACGGMGSNGLVPSFTPFSYKGIEKPLIGGIGREILQKLQSIGGSNRAGWPFLDAEAVKFVCDEILTESKVTVAYLTTVLKVKTRNRRLKSITVHDRSGIHELTADNFIDATGDAFISSSAGVPTLNGDPEGRTQPGSCCIVISGIDAKRLPLLKQASPVDGIISLTPLLREHTARYLAAGKLVNQGNFEYHIAGGNLDIDSGIARLNFGHFYDLGSCDPDKISKLLSDGRKYARKYVECLKKNMPGMENAVLTNTPSLPDIRESRRIVGRTTLPASAYWQGELHDDDIALYDYMVDVHAFDPAQQKKSLAANGYLKLLNNSIEKFYGIPFSIMLPEKFDNLAVAGRCVSAEQAMLGSLRVMPACMAMGQAAGTAAAMSRPLAKVNIKALQKKLRADKVILSYPY